MIDRAVLDELRRSPDEWRRRGLTPPADLDRMVEARVNGTTALPAGREFAYADFFTA